MGQDAKVAYADSKGRMSTAYVEITDTPSGRFATGTNKHTDLPVSLVWNVFLAEWVTHGCDHAWECANVYAGKWVCKTCGLEATA